MCTLIVGRDIVSPKSLLIAANRDEDPARPTDSPRILLDPPRTAGGRDRRSGGTWLAVRRNAVIAMLNRRPAVAAEPSHPSPRLRSRGLLALYVASARGTGATLAESAQYSALAGVRAARYAPFSLVFATAERTWMLAWDGAERVIDISPGWHVLTHAELDDPDEPRTQRLLRELETFRPASFDAARHGLQGLLAAHDEPRVCVHDGPMQTVSFAIVYLTSDGAHYHHGEGRPCEQATQDYTSLLEPRNEHA